MTVAVDWMELNGVESISSFNGLIVTDSNHYREYVPWEFVAENSNPDLISISGNIDMTEGVTLSLTGGVTMETIPDTDGNYTFAGIPAGENYTVSVAYAPPAPKVNVLQPAQDAILNGVQQVDAEIQGAVCDYIYSPEQYTYTGLTNSIENQDFVTTAAADCCVRVTRVTYRIGSLDYEDRTGSMCHGSYSWEFDTNDISNGDYYLYVTAYCLSGQAGQARIPVVIDNGGDPTPEPTPAIIPGTGEVWFEPEDSEVVNGEKFVVEVHLNSGDQLLAAYGFEISFDPSIIHFDTTVSENGVLPGPDGFITASSMLPPQ
jgi:hypothetical protein